MKNIFGKKNSKEELEFVMYCLMIMCVSSLLFVFFRNLDLCYDLGKDNTDNLIVKLLPENVTLLAMVVCSVLIYLMLRNVQKGLVFTKLNSDLIMTIGVVLECNGILQMAFNAFLSDSMDGNTIPMVYLLLGVFFLFIACLFKIGIRMQEEQDLTI
ncbi:uncharacterized protein BN744_01395 [Bacteroides sp. CAG:633]|uniref:DUF2975 domain-containing protein n=1 Tax=Bacteroides sp. CAG:633 TaxID=1262744 RepID=UPI000335158B|nr:DUF2975 domain-containing protein [Bacteroides sp. CAG:633]CDB10073.1 uncharacterized protein BN744_01395 [Bacteroides sp. CAG:633]